MGADTVEMGVYYRPGDYAGLGRRIVIAFVDMAILIALIMAIPAGLMELDLEPEAMANITFITLLVITFLYLVVLKRSKIGTVGYLVTGVKIVDLKGERPSVSKMIFRVLLLLVGPIGIFWDLLWLTSERTKQTIRDKMAGTYVVKRDAHPFGDGKLRRVMLGVLGWNLAFLEVAEREIN